jgi:hypothetical protein
LPGSASHETPGKLLDLLPDLLPDDPTAAGLPAPAVIPRAFKGGATEWGYWGSGTAHLLPRLLACPMAPPAAAGRCSCRTAAPAWRAGHPPRISAHTGRARLGYDRARILLDHYTSPGEGRPGWDLHQLRHSAATHLGEGSVALQLIMAKTRHRNPRTAMRYVKTGAEATAEVTELLDISPRRRG